MKKCKIFVILLKIFYMIACIPLQGQTFRMTDLDRLLRNHPLSEKYDPSTGRFRDTPSEIFSEEALEGHIRSLKSEIEMLEEKKKNLVKVSLVEGFDRQNEEKSWNEIAQIDESISNFRKTLIEKEQLLSIGGVPGVDKLGSVISGIYKDIREQNFTDSESVYLNRLPVYIRSFSGLSGRKNDLLKFFFNSEEKNLLEYLRYSYDIGMLIEATSMPILYERGSE